MNRKLRITYILGLSIRWLAHEWLAVRMNTDQFEVDFIILDEDDPLQFFLERQGIPYRVIGFEDYGDTPEVVKAIYDHLKTNKTDVVHTIFFNGHISGIQAAYYANVPVRVFTRQHAGVKHKRHAKSKYELIWEMATNALAVTSRGKRGMILDGVPPHKISIVPNGFDFSIYENVGNERIEEVRSKYNIPKSKYPIIGVLARYVEWKGIKYTIEAFREVLKTHPNAFFVLAGSQKNVVAKKQLKQKAAKKGTYGGQKNNVVEDIEERLSTLPSDSFIEIPFEKDLAALLKLLDIFVHVPINEEVETFGQVYIDAMLSKVPSVITKSGCANDYAVHKENAWVVNHKNIPQITEGILQIASDKTLRAKIIDNAFNVAQNYSIDRQIQSLQDLYLSTYQKMTNQVELKKVEEVRGA